MGKSWNWFMGTVRQIVKFVIIVAIIGAAGYGAWWGVKKFVRKTQQKAGGARDNRARAQERQSGTKVK
jgi:hypothetical protein